jgi:hypothetical protein
MILSLVSALAFGVITSTPTLSLPTSAAASEPTEAFQQQNAQDQQYRGSRGETTAQQFMQSLLAYGQWIAHPTFGWVWQPNDVQPWWQPFTVGDWIVTQDGTPYWRSGLPFGWATEHYGSWTFDDNKGWLWIPSNDWSQAPVSWRATNGVIGWAPRMAAGTGGTTTAVQTAPCAQPAFAWVFISSDRFFTTTNFAVAEQEFMARDVHGTWGNWAHTHDGIDGARFPEPRNPNLMGVTNCLGEREVVDLIGGLAASRGLARQGPPITWVLNRFQMGAGRTTNGRLPVYAPLVTGSPPPLSSTFFVNPPAPRVQRAQPIARAQGASRIVPAGRATPQAPLPTVAPVQPALPTPPAVPATPRMPLTPYDAFAFQQEALDDHHASQFDALCALQASEAGKPPLPGMTPEQVRAWHQRERQEMQRMAARQRRVLDGKQSEVNETTDAHAVPPTALPAEAPSDTQPQTSEPAQTTP